MPISGLYQTGSCTYPGGSVTGAPGRNRAMVMLKDFGTTIEEVVKKTGSNQQAFIRVWLRPLNRRTAQAFQIPDSLSLSQSYQPSRSF